MSDPLHALGARLAARQDQRLASESPDDRILDVLVERVVRRQRAKGPRRATVPAWIAVAAGLSFGMALGVVLTATLATDDAPSLAFTVGPPPRPGLADESRAGDLRTWHEAGPDGLMLDFSDGSRVDLGAGGRGRVVRTDALGADVVVEGARAHVRVVPREHASWTVQTGPFLVEVKGTEFDLAWDAAGDELTLSLTSGRVVVTGCGLGGERTLEAGYAIRASCRTPRFEVTPIGPAGSARGPVATASTPASPEPEPSPTADAAAPPQPSPPPPAIEAAASSDPAAAPRRSPPPVRSVPPDWRSLAREGRYRDAYEVAHAAGFAEECDAAAAEDLMLLGDVARIAGRDGDARVAYLAARRRFPGTAPAARAAFALGRAALGHGDPRAATSWMETYLGEQPAGALAAAAVEVLLEAALRRGDVAAARAAAARYLVVRPDGPHARDARRLVEGASGMSRD